MKFTDQINALYQGLIVGKEKRSDEKPEEKAEEKSTVDPAADLTLTLTAVQGENETLKNKLSEYRELNETLTGEVASIKAELDAVKDSIPKLIEKVKNETRQSLVGLDSVEDDDKPSAVEIEAPEKRGLELVAEKFREQFAKLGI